MLDAPRTHTRRESDEGERRDAAVRCRACEQRLAHLGERVQIGNGELHTFVNPSGEVFELVCFSSVPGAIARGRPTLEFTWFPGHAWTFALCRACRAQVGWHYRGPTSFWGLHRGALLWPSER